MSFFLWSSIPDDELLDLAAHSKLNDPKVLEQQVRRMLADSRASSLVSNSASASRLSQPSTCQDLSVSRTKRRAAGTAAGSGS